MRNADQCSLTMSTQFAGTSTCVVEFIECQLRAVEHVYHSRVHVRRDYCAL